MNKVATLAEIRPTSAIDLPDTTVSAREAFEIETDMVVPAFSVRTEHVPDIEHGLQVRPARRHSRSWRGLPTTGAR